MWDNSGIIKLENRVKSIQPDKKKQSEDNSFCSDWRARRTILRQFFYQHLFVLFDLLFFNIREI